MAREKTKEITLLPLLSTLALAALASACGEADYYARVQAVCDYQATAGKITPACSQAMASVLSFDEQSWADAPTGLKDRVVEGFAALVAYPLHVPADNTLLGVKPAAQGVIPLAQLDIVADDENPNRALFNAMLNNIDTIQFEQADPHGAYAVSTVNPFSRKPRRITIHPAFYNPGDSISYQTRGTAYSFVRASILAHEFMHSRGMIHEACSDGAYHCDAELAGPYGFGVAYLHFLVQGSHALLTSNELSAIDTQMCATLKYNIDHLPDELRSLIVRRDCSFGNASWLLSHEGF